MFYNSTFNKANLNLLIYRDLPEALKLQKMCKPNSLAVITAQTVEIKSFALQSRSKWIPSFIAKKKKKKRAYFKSIKENQMYKDISGLRLLLTQGCLCRSMSHSSSSWSLLCLNITASTSQPQTHLEVSHFKTTWNLFYRVWKKKSRVIMQ